MKDLREKKLYLFDLDGTIYRETKLFSGVREFLNAIRQKGGDYVFITNNSSKSIKDYEKKLAKMGVPVTQESFYSSALATQIALREKYGDGLIYAEVTQSLAEQFREAGLNIAAKFNPNAVAVVVGTDTAVTGAKLRRTCRMLSIEGMPFYATHLDLCYPSSFGHVPDCGSLCYALTQATGKEPQYFGKPNPAVVLGAIERFGVGKEDALVVGDNLHTDILAGIRAGVDTVCVLTGEASLRQIEQGTIKPDYVFERVTDIPL